MATAETAHKLILIEPPLLYLAGLAVGFAAEYLVPTGLLDPVLSGLFGYAFIGLGLLVIALAIKAFFVAEVPIISAKPREKLMQEGIYNLTRNPDYVGFSCIFGGIGLVFNSLWILLLLVVVIAVMQWRYIGPQEVLLEQRYGAEYIRYARHVRRWI